MKPAWKGFPVHLKSLPGVTFTSATRAYKKSARVTPSFHHTNTASEWKGFTALILWLHSTQM